MVDCKQPGSSRVTLGQKIDLASGLMEIAYDTGAKVILQGPVTYSIESNGGYLAVGKLTGKLGKRGERREERGEVAANRQIPNPKSQNLNPSPLSPLPSPLFVIRTPTATVTDLGTEFGVEVSEQKTTKVCVFTGAVNIAHPNGRSGEVIHAGDAVWVASGEIRRVAPDETLRHFIRTIHPAVGPVLLADDFNGGLLDRTKWFTKTWTTEGRASVVQKNGRIELTNRGYLITRNQYDPDKLGGIEINGQWTFKTIDDILSIYTRCDGVMDLQHYETPFNGLGVYVLVDHWGQPQRLEIRCYGSVAVRDMVRTGRVTIHPGNTFNFHIVDKGTAGVSFNLTDARDSARTASVAAKLVAGAVSEYNHVVFCNRQYLANEGSDCVSYLDNVTIVAPAGLSVGGPTTGDTKTPNTPAHVKSAGKEERQ